VRGSAGFGKQSQVSAPSRVANSKAIATHINVGHPFVEAVEKSEVGLEAHFRALFVWKIVGIGAMEARCVELQVSTEISVRR